MQQPDTLWGQLLYYLEFGGFVAWPLAIGAMLLWFALGFRFLTLRRGTSLSLRLLVTKLQARLRSHGKFRAWGVIDTAAWRALQHLQNHHSGTAEDKIKQVLFPLHQELKRFAILVQVVVVSAPLLGLLGTVTGMIETFDALGSMSLFSQSGGIAGGISQALISTQIGLAVAIPGLLIGRLLSRRQQQLHDELEQLKALLCAQAEGRTLTPEQEAQVSKKGTMRIGRRKRATQAEVDMSPLIDMVFILLIFFMVSTTFVKDMKIELERPSASSATRASTKAVRIHLERNGGLYLDGSPVKVWMLQSRLRQILRSDRGRSILVVSDRLIQAEKLIEVVDQCRLAGAKDIGVATNKEAG